MLDTALSALADEHRRRLLVALLEHNPQEEPGVKVPEDVHDGDEEVEILHAQMIHNHLPQLETAGFITWDRDAHEIHKGPTFEDLRPLLELLHNHADELPEG